MFGLYEKHDRRYWRQIRACHCGHWGVSGTRWDDIVSCNGCGLLHRINPSINPIAKLVDKEGDEIIETYK